MKRDRVQEQVVRLTGVDIQLVLAQQLNEARTPRMQESFLLA